MKSGKTRSRKWFNYVGAACLVLFAGGALPPTVWEGTANAQQRFAPTRSPAAPIQRPMSMPRPSQRYSPPPPSYRAPASHSLSGGARFPHPGVIQPRGHDYPTPYCPGCGSAAPQELVYDTFTGQPYDPGIRSDYVSAVDERRSAIMERINKENAEFDERMAAEAAFYTRRQAEHIAAGERLRAAGLAFQERARAEAAEAQTLPQYVIWEKRAAQPIPDLRVYSEALRSDGEVDGAVARRLSGYFAEAGKAGATSAPSRVLQRAVCFDHGSAALPSGLEAMVAEVTQAAAQSGARVVVLGLASPSTGSDAVNAALAWTRATNVKALIKSEAHGLEVRAAGAFALQGKGLSVDPNQFTALFGTESKVAAGPGTPADRANRCAVIMVIPATGFEANLGFRVLRRRPT